jgi:hypothetical protein
MSLSQALIAEEDARGGATMFPSSLKGHAFTGILLRLENPKIRGIYDAKVVGDGIAINTPVSRHFIA